MTKQELREIYLDKRKKLSPAECAQLGLQISNLFFSSFDLSFVGVLHCYLPITKNQEPDTWVIIDRLRRECPQVRLSVPRVGVNGELENFYFEGLHQLGNSPLGIQEPKQGVPTPADKIDLVIVPLLAVDQYGHRVGYGKGYYDRFLKTCNKECRKVGLSFFKPVELITDANKQDVQLDFCIEPSRVHHF